MREQQHLRVSLLARRPHALQKLARLWWLLSVHYWLEAAHPHLMLCVREAFPHNVTVLHAGNCAAQSTCNQARSKHNVALTMHVHYEWTSAKRPSTPQLAGPERFPTRVSGRGSDMSVGASWLPGKK